VASRDWFLPSRGSSRRAGLELSVYFSLQGLWDRTHLRDVRVHLHARVHAVELAHEGRIHVPVPDLGPVVPAGPVHRDGVSRGGRDGIPCGRLDLGPHVVSKKL
jgi:hypothetical protein